MKIEDKRDKRVQFGNLIEGEVFVDEERDNHPYMKIFEAETESECVNAVSLANAELAWYRVEDKVSKVNAKVVIE